MLTVPGAIVNKVHFLAMAASDFTLDSVQDFMLSHGGRVKNHELVTHFKAYLNDPERKGARKIKLTYFL